MKYASIIAISMFFASISANASNESLDSMRTSNVNEVTIQSRKDPDTLTMIGKMKIKEMDMPQTMSIIDEKMLKQQQVSSMTDLLKNANGLYIMGTTGGYQEEIASRGSSITSSNTFKNGIRYFGGMKTELSGIEKAEILKGNAAILFGNVAPGGVLNLVTKKPQFTSGGSVGLSYGSFNRVKPQFDVFGSVNKSKTIAFRLNSSFEKSNSFRKEVTSEMFYINPSLLFNITKKTNIIVEGDFSKYETTPDFGAGIINYEIVDIPRDRFLGVSWGKYKAQQSFVSTKITHQVSKGISLSYLSGYRNYNTELFSNARPNTSGSVIAANGIWKRNIQRSAVEDNYFIQQFDFNANFNTGFLKHQTLIGADFENYTTSTLSYNNFNKYDSVNVFNNYNSSLEPAIPTLTKNTNTDNPVARMGFYFQDLISFHKYFKVLAGLRYSSITSVTNTFKYSDSTSTNVSKTDKAFSPKIGIVFQPNERQTIFASYSNSFVLNTGVDIDGKALAPSLVDQYEIGIKNKFYNNRLSIQLTGYQILNSNLAQTSLVNGNSNSNIKELSGETVSKGIELDFIFQPNPFFNITSGYSFNETKYTKSTMYVVGSELRYNPKHTGNISLNYTIHNGMFKNVQLGLMNTYIGNRYAGRSTRVTVQNDNYKLIPLSSYLITDITASYMYKKFNIKTKLANVANVLNYNIHDDNSLNPIAPRNYSVSLIYNL